MNRMKYNFWCKDRNKMFLWMKDFKAINMVDGEMKPVLNDDVEKNWEWYKLKYIPLQFTGIKDKNGREIYEGDIVAYIDSCEPTGYSYERDEFLNYGKVIWNEECARFDITNRNDVSDEDVWDGDSIEIIGNIHDNPTMLEDMLKIIWNE